MERQQIIDLNITAQQLKQIRNLEGIGKESHFLGGPQLAGVVKNGENIGWGNSIYKNVPVLQTKTDMENWVIIINNYQPDIIFEMGAAHGGNIIYLNDVLINIHKKPKFFGVDISDFIYAEVKQMDNFSLILGSTISDDVFEKIKSIVDDNKDKRILFHFDDCHDSAHVLQELRMYSNIIKHKDVIIVGDTWDEGWYNSPFQALYEFVSENDTMTIDENMNKCMDMPCNWIFGILIKNDTSI